MKVKLGSLVKFLPVLAVVGPVGLLVLLNRLSEGTVGLGVFFVSLVVCIAVTVLGIFSIRREIMLPAHQSRGRYVR